MTDHRRALALAATLMLASVLPAFAHAHLESAVPAADAVVPVAPAELELHFTEAVELDFTGLTVTHDGVAVPHGAVVVDPVDPAAISVGFDAPLAAGSYTVDWHAVAADGHKSDGSYGFTVAP